MEKIIKLVKKVFRYRKMSRRSFITASLTGLVTLLLPSWLTRRALAESTPSNGRKASGVKGNHDLVVAQGDDPGQMAHKAIEALGGMGLFVKKGDVVVVKPNIGWDRTPEQAANTNPDVVAAIVAMCFEAGASRVNVFDNTCNSPRRCYANSGIQKAAEAQGAKVYLVDNWNTVKAHFSYDSLMEGWPVYRDAVECDVFINVPILKHHGGTKLTLSMKNLMGICSDVRGKIHNQIGKKLVDMTDFIKPDLTVIDGYRYLTNHGPSGGDLEDVKLLKTLIAGTDPTLCDMYACKVAGVDHQKVPYVKEAISRGFGNSDLANAKIKQIKV